jgi:hypothetical protein
MLLANLAQKCDFEVLKCTVFSSKNEALAWETVLEEIPSLGADSILRLVPNVQKKDKPQPDGDGGENNLSIEILEDEFKPNPHMQRDDHSISFSVPGFGAEELEFLSKQLTQRSSVCRQKRQNIWEIQQTTEKVKSEGGKSFLQKMASAVNTKAVQAWTNRKHRNAAAKENEEPIAAAAPKSPVSLDEPSPRRRPSRPPPPPPVPKRKEVVKFLPMSVIVALVAVVLYFALFKA